MRHFTQKLVSTALAGLCWTTISQSAGAIEGTETHSIGSGFQLTLAKPVVVSLAEPGEHRWGRHQFVSLSRYPGQRLLLRFHAGEDSVRAYGTGQPTFISKDHGNTWTPFQEQGLPESGLVSELAFGASLCMPMPKPLNVAVEGAILPEPAGDFFTYRKMLVYPADKCPESVREHLRTQSAHRWEPETKAWVSDKVTIDIRQRMVWIAQGQEAGLISGTSFERAPIRVGNELLWADYRAIYAMPDGSAPKGFGVSCMVSTNNGRSWIRRAPIVDADAIPGEISSMTEPVLAQNAQGEIICIIRRTDQQQKSMLLSFSSDNGKTWSKPRALTEFGNLGVMPDLLKLESGPMVLTYGRPHVYLTFSLEGTGKTWEKPLTLVASDPDSKNVKTDGYTSLMAIGKNEFLIGYSDFEYPDEQGRKRKAILVRRATLARTAP